MLPGRGAPGRRCAAAAPGFAWVGKPPEAPGRETGGRGPGVGRAARGVSAATVCWGLGLASVWPGLGLEKLGGASPTLGAAGLTTPGLATPGLGAKGLGATRLGVVTVPAAAGVSATGGSGGGWVRPPSAVFVTTRGVGTGPGLRVAVGLSVDEAAGFSFSGAGAAPPWSDLIFSVTRRTTGASIVEEAERTNSPMSFNLPNSSLLSSPSSLASS